MNKLNYGIEMEFFVNDNEDRIVPAFMATSNLDGNPVIGELRTGVFDNIVDCVYNLKKLIYNEKIALAAKGYKMVLASMVKVDNDFIKNLRGAAGYTNRKQLEPLTELSIYPNGSTGKVLGKGVYKASLQVNMSFNREFAYPIYKKLQLANEYTYQSEPKVQIYSSLFDFNSIIAKLDKVFAKDISSTTRVKGVYAIKDGELGSRIEYRSLPNTIDLDQLIETLR